MSEGTGWAGRLRRVVNARMEEMSFRSGVAVFAGVLALTGGGIALTVTLGGGHPAAAAPPSASTERHPEPGGISVVGLRGAPIVGQPVGHPWRAAIRPGAHQ